MLDKIAKAAWNTALILLILLSVVVISMQISGVNLAVDAQKVAGEPSCLPYEFYLWHKGLDASLQKGDYIVISMPDKGYKIGARPGDRVIKKVAALPGDRVRISGTELYINEKHVDRLWLAKSIDGKKPGDFDADMVLNKDQVFLMGTTKESFDSRYWGPVRRDSIIGRALPLL